MKWTPKVGRGTFSNTSNKATMQKVTSLSSILLRLLLFGKDTLNRLFIHTELQSPPTPPTPLFIRKTIKKLTCKINSYVREDIALTEYFLTL